MPRKYLTAWSIATLSLVAAAPLAAADLTAQPPARDVSARFHCGPCGCLRVAYVYHREVRSTYGLNFDPRNDDQTEPHYYLGAVRRYPRYFVAGLPISEAPPVCRLPR